MSITKYQMVEEDYDAVDVAFHNAYNTVAEYDNQIASFLNSMKPGQEVLNIGGTATECSYFADQSLTVTNIDISQAMLEYIAQTDSRIHTEKANILTYRHAPFDGVWACRSLIHIPPEDLKKVLVNIRSLLRPGGTFGAIFFTTGEMLKEEYLDEVHTNKPNITYYRVLYSAQYLKEMAKSAGFKVRRSELCTDQDGEQSLYLELVWT